MNTLLWLLDKICAILADIGLLCLVVLLVADDGTAALITCSIIGLPCAALGGFVGGKVWHHDIAPFTLFFRNRLQLGESLASAVMVWAIRFFLLPFIGAAIFYVLA